MAINKISLILVLVAMIFATTVLLSNQTATAQNTNENSKELLGQLKNGTETSYSISIDVNGTSRAVGIFGDCNVDGKKVKTSECVFSVDEVRYTDTFSQVKFEVICIDNITKRNELGKSRWSNCSFLDRGAVSIGISVAIPLGIGFIGKAGEGASGGFGIDFGSETDIGISYDAIRLEYLMHNPTEFRGLPSGGNVLVDSGIGGVLAGKYVILAHDGFKGTVEFVGSKPLHMKMFTGFVGNTSSPECRNDTGGKVNCDGNLAGFKTALELASPGFFSLEQSNLAANAEPVTTNAITKVDAEILNQIVVKARPQLVELTSLNKKLALEIIQLDETITMYKQLRDKALMDKLVNQLVKEIVKKTEKNNPELIMIDIIKKLNLTDFRPALKAIASLITPLGVIENLVFNEIPPPSGIKDDVKSIATKLKTTDTKQKEASFNFDVDFVKCTIPFDGKKSCTVQDQKVNVGNFAVCTEVKIVDNRIATKAIDGCICDPKFPGC